MAQAREAGLEECKSEFGDLVSVSREETGEIVIDLGTEDAYFFQIKWKIVPSLRHFSRVKNICRIACTQDGNLNHLKCILKKCNSFIVFYDGGNRRQIYQG